MAKKTKTKKAPEYMETKLRPIIQIAARMVQKNPSMADNMDYLWACLQTSIEGLNDKSQCGACGRSMKVTIYEADLHDALLLLAMAQQVRKNMKSGMSFTEANKVHIPTLTASQATLKRQTKCDYLGFVKQPDNWRGTGFWLLTGWAWKALRGEPVPKAVKYWEGKMQVRSTRTTTLPEMFQNHRDLIQKIIIKRGMVKVDHRAQFDGYNPKDWITFDFGDELPTQPELL